MSSSTATARRPQALAPVHRSLLAAWFLIIALAPPAFAAPAAFGAGAAGPLSQRTPSSARLHPAADLNLGILAPIMPELRTAPAPPWLKTGLRLVYAGGEATVDGGWTGPPRRSLSRYRSASAPDRLASVGGSGVTVDDIIAVGESSVLINVGIYIQPGGPGAPPQFSTGLVLRGAPGAGADLWISPALLNKFRGLGKEITVTRQPYQLGNRSVPSVWIKTNSSKGYEVHVYEQATGLLIHYSATYGVNTGSFLANGTLVEKRLLKTPWLGHYAPPAAVHAATYHYSGVTTTSIGGAYPLRLPVTLSLAPASHGTDWMIFSTTLTQSPGSGLPPTVSKNEVGSGPGQFTNLWLPPADLQQLTDGQVLDRDPITQSTTTVSRRTLPDGRSLVILSLSGPTRLDFGYDEKTGLVVAEARTDQIGPGTTQTAIQLDR